MAIQNKLMALFHFESLSYCASQAKGKLVVCLPPQKNKNIEIKLVVP